MHDDEDFTNRIWKLARGGEDPVLQKHIDTCDMCRIELDALGLLAQYQETTGGKMHDLPNDLSSTLSGLLRRIRPDLGQSASAVPTLTEKLKTVWAELLQDTGAQTQIVGLRGEADARTRQIAFVSDIADLDLEVSPSDNAFGIFGQFGIDEVPEGLRIRFVRAEEDPLSPTAEGVIEVPVSDQGYFRLTVDAGEWVVVVTLDDAVVLFPGVQL